VPTTRQRPELEHLEERLTPALAAAELNGLFDQNYYLATNPDVAHAVQQGQLTALQHFVFYGQYEQRDPLLLFDSHFYAEQNPDLAPFLAAGTMTSYEHFIRYGQWEGRRPFELFSNAYYLNTNADVAGAVGAHQISGWEHFLWYGQYEKRDPSPYFNTQIYLQSNQDVAQAVAGGSLTAIQHYLLYGFEERRPRLPASLTWSSVSGDGLARADRAVGTALGHALYGRAYLSAQIGQNYRDLDDMGVAAVWGRGITGTGQVVAVIGVGVNINNFELVGQTVQGHNFVLGENPNDPTPNPNAPNIGHDTRVAGIVAASGVGGPNGTIGIAPGAKIMPLKVSDDINNIPDNLAGQAILYAVNHGATIINLSFGGGSPDATLNGDIKYAASHNVVVVIASGDTGDSSPEPPADLAANTTPAVLAVGGVDDFRRHDPESNGAAGMTYYVVGPSVGITAPDLGNTLHTGNGTSYSAPYVAGIAALVRQANPNLTVQQVISIIDGSADPNVEW
jgi:subtilisin family serine protease